MHINSIYQALTKVVNDEKADFGFADSAFSIKGATGEPRVFKLLSPEKSASSGSLHVRQALAQAIRADLGETAFKAIEKQLVGESSESAAAKLTPLEARKIIDAARAADPKAVISRVTSSLVVSKFSEPVKELLVKTAQKFASNPAVANFLVGKKRDLDGLTRLAALAIHAFPVTEKTPPQERLALAYLKGFGMTMLDQVNVKDETGASATDDLTDDVANQQEKGEKDHANESLTENDGSQKGTVITDQKNPPPTSDGANLAPENANDAEGIGKWLASIPDRVKAPTDLKTVKEDITKIAAGLKGKAWVNGDQSCTDNTSPDQTLTVKGKDSKTTYQVKSHQNNGGGKNNCFFLSSLKLMGLPVDNAHAFALRAYLHRQYQCLLAEGKNGGAENDQVQNVFTALAKFYGKEQGSETKPTDGKMADVAHAALLAQILRREVQVFTVVGGKTEEATVQSFGTDLTDGKTALKTNQEEKPLSILYTTTALDSGSGHFQALEIAGEPQTVAVWTPAAQLKNVLGSQQDEQAVDTLAQVVGQQLKSFEGTYEGIDLDAEKLFAKLTFNETEKNALLACLKPDEETDKKVFSILQGAIGRTFAQATLNKFADFANVKGTPDDTVVTISDAKGFLFHVSTAKNPTVPADLDKAAREKFLEAVRHRLNASTNKDLQAAVNAALEPKGETLTVKTIKSVMTVFYKFEQEGAGWTVFDQKDLIKEQEEEDLQKKLAKVLEEGQNAHLQESKVGTEKVLNQKEAEKPKTVAADAIRKKFPGIDEDESPLRPIYNFAQQVDGEEGTLSERAVDLLAFYAEKKAAISYYKEGGEAGFNNFLSDKLMGVYGIMAVLLAQKLDAIAAAATKEDFTGNGTRLSRQIARAIDDAATGSLKPDKIKAPAVAEGASAAGAQKVEYVDRNPPAGMEGLKDFYDFINKNHENPDAIVKLDGTDANSSSALMMSRNVQVSLAVNTTDKIHRLFRPEQDKKANQAVRSVFVARIEQALGVQRSNFEPLPKPVADAFSTGRYRTSDSPLTVRRIGLVLEAAEKYLAEKGKSIN